MSGAEINKVILAVMTTLLVILLISNVVNELWHTEPLEHNAYAVAVPDQPAQPTAQEAAAPALEPVTALLATADAAAGEKASKRCATCHTFDNGGANKIGPNLWGIVGKDKGTVAGFAYSAAIREHGGTWSYDELNAFLADPKGLIGGTKMNFAGIKSVQERADIIAYMRQQAASPAPLPAQ